MEDLIYVIVLIAWVVFAYYRRMQKKAQATRKTFPGPESRPEARPMPTLQEILFGEESIPAEERVPQSYDAEEEGNYSPKHVETSFEKEYNLRGITSVEELVRNEEILSGKRDEKQKEKDSEEADRHGPEEPVFDIRQAVIYSEILNRPYV